MITSKEELSEQVKTFLEKNKSVSSDAQAIIEILSSIKQKNGITLEMAMEVFHELCGYTPRTIKEIAFQTRFKRELIALKHVNYFMAICRNCALGPKFIYTSSMLKVNY